MSTLAEAVVRVTAELGRAGVASPAVDARWLVLAASGRDPRREPDGMLDTEERSALEALVARRRGREPLQLVVGTTAFRGIELLCRPGVFVPRPETEVLAGIAIGLATELHTDGVASVVVHEPCCGTGAVGLAVASELADVDVILGDRSEVAVALATENRDRLAGDGRLRSSVRVRHGDLLDAFDGAGGRAADVIVANPPYLPVSELAGLDPEVARHDPRDALSGGPDGHEVVVRLLAAAAEVLAPGGAVALEIDVRRAAETRDLALELGLERVVSHRDLTGAPRFIVAHRPGGRGTQG